jgi:hypothetical protein
MWFHDFSYGRQSRPRFYTQPIFLGCYSRRAFRETLVGITRDG